MRVSVLVIGDICLDRDCIVKPGVQSWEECEGTPQDIISERWQPGGAGNLAAGFSALGATTTVVGTWGGWYKDFLEHALAASRVYYDGMIVAGRTPVFEKDYTEDGTQIARRNVPSTPLTGKVHHALCDKVSKLGKLADADIVVVADYDEYGHGVVSEQLLAVVGRLEQPLFGTSRGRADRFEFDYVIVNNRELRGRTPEGFLRLTGSENLVVTMAAQGSSWYQGSEPAFKLAVPSPKVEGNACGAGDSFFAAFALAIAYGASVEEAMKMGNAAGRCCVRHSFGAHAVSLAELEEELSEANC